VDGLHRKIEFFGDDLNAVPGKFKCPGTKNLCESFEIGMGLGMDFGLRFGKANRRNRSPKLLRFVQTEPILGVTEDIFFFTTKEAR